MLRKYETVYIFDSTLDETQVNERLERFHGLIRKDDGPEFEVNHWGKRTLAYPIRKRETGYYVIANFSTEPAALPEYERAIKLDEGVLRHMVVMNEGPQPVPATEKKSEEDED